MTPTIDGPSTVRTKERESQCKTIVKDLVFMRDMLCEFHVAHIPQARRRLNTLVTAGILKSETLAAIPATHVELLHVHYPNNSHPDWDLLSTELKRRWRAEQPQEVRIYYAAPKTIRTFGGDMPGRITHLDAIGHDIALSTVFYALVRATPALRDAWIPEARIPQAYATVHPDAVIADSSGPRAIIEMCGLYSAERLSKLAEFASFENVPLQLWTIASRREP